MFESVRKILAILGDTASAALNVAQKIEMFVFCAEKIVILGTSAAMCGKFWQNRAPTCAEKKCDFGSKSEMTFRCAAGGPIKGRWRCGIRCQPVCCGLSGVFLTAGGAVAVRVGLTGDFGVVVVVGFLRGSGGGVGGDTGVGGSTTGSAGGVWGWEGGLTQDGVVVSGGATAGFGGHSRFSCGAWSTEDVLGGAFFVCCSNLPIRFATLWRGRSSGNGLRVQLSIIDRVNVGKYSHCRWYTMYKQKSEERMAVSVDKGRVRT